MTKNFFLLLSLLTGLYCTAQTKKPLPVIDMHLHAIGADDQGPPPLKMGVPFDNFGYHDPKNEYGSTFMEALKTGKWAKHSTSSPLTDDSLQVQTLRVLRSNNVYAVTSGDMSIVRKWHTQEPKRIMKGVYWDFRSVKKNGLTVDSLRKLFRSGEFAIFGEVAIQYEGISPSDTAFDPYLKMAEELDIPVGIHVGPGPPGVIYLGAQKYRASLHSALVLENALVKHPKLRLYAMHAGWPMIDDMLAALYAHPQLYVDLGVICYHIPEKEFYFYLERLVNAGFGKRIMFGSDNMVWPQTIKIGIDRIKNATFLSEEQKRDILFNNATRFLRLTPEQIKAMY
ncbi:amidohydrolase family protein [Cytophagaceae bacterium DM2B3-1]|uniref:Amidohydrolase family protein n=1 Tax=Xanthocytophaga flava TaxID=3048013 RepID=A0ABT7CXE5_9BACT|nr:amidohydrolase family protein [Xanthocytophaga flavus]MDJ1498435.1 amidohydrolase family protein [Xanthocytophaga flavus]